MRDTERIEVIMAAFKNAWHEYPDSRFGQLFANLTGHHRDPFYVSDQELMDALGIEDVTEFTGRNNFMDNLGI